MKNSKRLLTCTLGLMLGVGILTGCGEKPEPTTGPVTANEYTVTFKRGNEELHTETVKEGEKCPEYTPDEVTGYDFMGWYETRQHTGDKFNFDTPITADLTLYAWFKEEFKPTTDTYYVVGSFEGGAWDGAAGDPREGGWANRVMTLNEAELANEHNVFEFTIPSIKFGEKFRMIKSTDGLVSDGWTDSYGFDIVNKIYDVDGTEIAKADAVKEEDSKNIGILIPGKIKVTLDLNSTFNPVGEITLTYIEKNEIKFPTHIGLVGVIGGESLWPSDTNVTDIEFATADEGRTWTLKIALTAGDQVKIRMDHAWTASWGWSAVVSSPDGAFAEATETDADGNVKGNGNIACLTSGEYVITFVYLSNSITIAAA